MPTDLTAVLRVIAGHGLTTDGLTEPAEPVAANADAWRTIAPLVSRQRLTGLAVAALAAGALVLEDEDRLDLVGRDRQVQAQALRAERLTLALCAELDAAGVEHLVLKGTAYAHSRYADPALRPFIDVDLLVPADRLAAVVALCADAGCTRATPELRPGFDRRFAKSVTLGHPSGVDIDLHRTLSLGPLTHLVAMDDLWSGRASVEVIPGRSIPVLSADAAFLHACLHAGAAGPPRWLVLRDVLETARDADLDRCARLARRWTATAVVVAAAAAVADRGLPLPARLAEWAEGLDPSAGERRVARAYEPTRPSARHLALAGWRYVPGLLGKAAYARALLLPSVANRRSRHRSAAGHARRVLGGPA